MASDGFRVLSDCFGWLPIASECSLIASGGFRSLSECSPLSSERSTQGLEDKRRRELGYGGGGPEIGDGAIVTTTAGMDTADLLEKFGTKAQVQRRPGSRVHADCNQR